jgi:NAD(P)-dependent dehydrogenase (short-subunit alcohol dehydrogenase family)
MTGLPFKTALIVGAGPGISASVARLLARLGVKVGLAARNPAKLQSLVRDIGAESFTADARHPDAVAGLFADATARLGDIDIVVYNAGSRAPGPLSDLDPAVVADVIAVNAYGGFLVVQQAAKRMVPRGSGAILLTGATASVKGFSQSAAFAMGKFALRGLAQSAARELGPKGIHVAHFIIDGVVRSTTRLPPADQPDSFLDPEAVAQTYVDVLRQSRSAWSFEVEVRPWVERF